MVGSLGHVNMGACMSPTCVVVMIDIAIETLLSSITKYTYNNGKAGITWASGVTPQISCRSDKIRGACMVEDSCGHIPLIDSRGWSTLAANMDEEFRQIWKL